MAELAAVAGELWADVRIMNRKMEIITLASPKCQTYGLLSETCKGAPNQLLRRFFVLSPRS